jgi:hypothetical protein
MRIQLFIASVALGALAGGCKWTDFDDLADQTWVRAIDDPQLGATDYAVAIAGVSTGPSGGLLAVLSDDTPNYSTIEYTAAGGADVGTNPAPIKLGTQNIGAFADQPVFVVDAPAGRIAIVERSINAGNFAVVFGTPTAPAGIEVQSGVQPTPIPDAGTFVGSDLVFVADDRIYTLSATGGTPKTCQATDHLDMPLRAAAIAATANDLVVWTKTGALLGYALPTLATCEDGMVSAPRLLSEMSPQNFMPGPGARIHLVGKFAILAGRAASSRVGQVHVVDAENGGQIGTALTAEGLRSSTIADLDGTLYLAIGVPDRSVRGVVAGAVDLHKFTPAPTALELLDATPALTLHDADPESGQQFGRTVTTMLFNGRTILVVGATAEVFAYYRTALYNHLP